MRIVGDETRTMLEGIEDGMEKRAEFHSEVVERLVFKLEERESVIENALHKTSIATEFKSTEIALIINTFLSFIGE